MDQPSGHRHRTEVLDVHLHRFDCSVPVQGAGQFGIESDPDALFFRHRPPHFGLDVAIPLLSKLGAHALDGVWARAGEINGWPLNLANTFVVGNLRFINELMVIAAIAIGLVIYEPIVLLSVAVLLTIGAVIIRKGTKNRLERYSEIQKSSDLKRAR